ncbi:hypothetical protein COCCADRAFT_94549 [Bipolaris zeicola 26-R-13]|uniref:REJ domain-containing protein n=1 Tax=Cochliobolus carbonum (strain 26-R-13) TaxID=930089 RepID=W6YRA5_COCC2|nr:uncharacterized protein COCCADRAFT_94549 [Bipolaris zeicola 26-R-13]EUC34021.1 hypothetical protein COCCADRAFT_94549 [Bipolaris zeicola 26-R-13]
MTWNCDTSSTVTSVNCLVASCSVLPLLWCASSKPTSTCSTSRPLSSMSSSVLPPVEKFAVCSALMIMSSLSSTTCLSLTISLISFAFFTESLPSMVSSPFLRRSVKVSTSSWMVTSPLRTCVSVRSLFSFELPRPAMST